MESQGGRLAGQQCHTLSPVRASIQPGGPCTRREAPSYRPLPRNAARGLACTGQRSTHPPFWGAGLAQAVTWALIGQGLKRRL